MGWLPVFLDETDAKVLIDWLNQEQEIAFIVPDGYNRWKATPTVSSLSDGDYSLWHVPGGSLKLNTSGSEKIIADPWSGWTGHIRGGDPTEIRLSLNTRHQPYSQRELNELRTFTSYWLRDNDYIVVSGFQWIGNHYWKAPETTNKWWQKLRKWVKGEAVMLQNRKHDTIFWAFPSAFQKLKDGMEYWCNGFNLDRALKEAKLLKKHIEAELDKTPKPLPTDVVLGGEAKPLPTDVVLGSKHRKRQYS